MMLCFKNLPVILSNPTKFRINLFLNLNFVGSGTLPMLTQFGFTNRFRVKILNL